MGQARRDRQVSDRAAGRHPGRTRGHAGEPGRGLGVGGVRHGGTPAQRGQAGGHLDRGPDHRRWPRHTPARRRRAAGDFRRQHLRDLGWQTLTDRSDQQGGHLELGARPRRDITNTDLTGALRRAARDRAAAGASGARGGHPVDVGAGRSGGIGVAGPNRRRGQPVLCAAARRGAKDQQLRGRSAAQRELLRGGGAAGGDPRCAGPHTAGDLAAGGVLPGRAAEFR